MPAYSRPTEDMSANFKDLLESGLEQAVQQHFCKLFDVLMSASDRENSAVDRFEAGLKKLARMEAIAGVMISEVEK